MNTQDRRRTMSNHTVGMTHGNDRPIVILGAGAVGSYVGALLAASGNPVVLVDGWPEHVEAIRRDGLVAAHPDGTVTAHPQVLHLGEIHRLRRLAPVAAFLTVKLYDTAWAARLLAQWLGGPVPVVTLQNGLVEETVARAVGWGRTLGAIGSGLHVALDGPGVVRRARRRRRDGGAPVFEIGELHGRPTPRARQLAALLDQVDRAEVTTDLWNHRWSKLCANAMISGLSGVSGLGMRDVYMRDDTRRLAVALAGEGLLVGAALGFSPPSIFGLPAGTWLLGANDDADALADGFAALAAQADGLEAGAISGTAQDLASQRPTEVEFFNGHIAGEGRRIGVAAGTHAALAAVVREAEAGTRPIGPEAIAAIANLSRSGRRPARGTDTDRRSARPRPGA
jgi:2-dehydropantoate 2-reductase